MAQRVCPHWVGCLLLNPLRRLIHNPDQILASYVTGGMTVLDIGPGMPRPAQRVVLGPEDRRRRRHH